MRIVYNCELSELAPGETGFVPPHALMVEANGACWMPEAQSLVDPRRISKGRCFEVWYDIDGLYAKAHGLMKRAVRSADYLELTTVDYIPVIALSGKWKIRFSPIS